MVRSQKLGRKKIIGLSGSLWLGRVLLNPPDPTWGMGLRAGLSMLHEQKDSYINLKSKDKEGKTHMLAPTKQLNCSWSVEQSFQTDGENDWGLSRRTEQPLCTTREEQNTRLDCHMSKRKRSLSQKAYNAHYQLNVVLYEKRKTSSNLCVNYPTKDH